MQIDDGPWTCGLGTLASRRSGRPGRARKDAIPAKVGILDVAAGIWSTSYRRDGFPGLAGSYSPSPRPLLSAMEHARQKDGTGGCARADRLGRASQLGRLEAGRMYTGRYRLGQCGHMWYLPRASHSCHYLFRPPVESTPKLGLVSAAVVVASKIVLSRAR